MAFAQHVWNQLKSITADELIAALKRDGYRQDPASADGTIAFIKVGNLKSGQSAQTHRYSLPSTKDIRPKIVESLLADIGWSEADLRRVKLIK